MIPIHNTSQRVRRNIACLAALGTSLAAIASPAHAEVGAAPAAEAGSDDSGDILVTARRRTESIQSVPLAVTKLGEADLTKQDYTDVLDLNFAVPNMSLFQSVGTPGALQAYIRGVGTDDFAFTAEQGVGIYLDGIIINKQQGAMLDLVDLDGVEVLRGPQGTLYGRNSTGGAIKFTTKRPDLNDIKAFGELTIGRFNRFDQAVSVSVPIIPGELAVRLTAQNRRSDGYMKDVNSSTDYNNIDRQGFRISALYTPNSALTVYLTGDYAQDFSNIQLPTPLVATTASGKYIHDGYGPLYGDAFLASTSLPNINKLRNGGGTADITYDLGPVSVKSLTGYRKLKQAWAFEGDGTAASSIDLLTWMRQNQFSEELQLLSNGNGRLNYTAGLYYFHESVKVNSDVIFQGTRNYGDQTTASYAAYADGTFEVVPNVHLTAGARYSHDKKDILTQGWSRATGLQLFDVTKSVSFNSFTPRAGIDWQATPRILVYANVSKGYKAGGFASGRPSDLSQATAVYNPEKVTTYEGGVKTELFDRHLRFNVNYFYNDYTNFQLTYRANNQLFVTTADAKMHGVEIEANARVTDRFSLHGNFGYTDGKYTKLPINPATGAFVGGLFPKAKLKEIPPYSFAVGGNYEQPIGSVGTLALNLDYTYHRRIYHNGANSLPVSTPPTGTLDAQVSFRTIDDKWTVSTGIRNLTNEPIQNSGNAPSSSRFYQAPASWYLTFKFNL